MHCKDKIQITSAPLQMQIALFICLQKKEMFLLENWWKCIFFLNISIPFIDFFSNNKEQQSRCHKLQNGHFGFCKSGSFGKDASHAIGNEGKWQLADNNGQPVGEIMVTEKYSGADHHGHGYRVDDSICNLSVAGARRKKHCEAEENNVPCQYHCDQCQHAALNRHVEIPPGKK